MKALPIFNAVGCLFLAGFIVVQWHSTQKIEKDLRASRLNERNVLNEKVEVEQRVVQLQADVDNFKGVIELMKAEEEAAKKKIVDGELLAHQLHTGLSFSSVHLIAMDQAIAQQNARLTEQNARISELNSSVAATRKRLDEAIAKLKEAGAQ